MPATGIRWGIVATGNIAGVFTQDLKHLADHRVVAVGSRDRARAEAFATRHHRPDHPPIRAYGSYPEVADDPDVDVVYVATPHSDHYSTARYALEAGKGVLVEKAFTVNAAQAADLLELARAKQRFCMEAMWMRCNPLHLKLAELVSDGAIGEPRTLRAELCFTPPYDPADRLFAPELAGGALLDVGIYPIGLAYHLFGAPETISATAVPAPTGVDGTVAMWLTWPDGKIATLTGSLLGEASNTAAVGGTEGWIELPRSFHDTARLTLHRTDRSPEEFGVDLLGVGYTYEAEAVAHAVEAGAIESPLVTHADTLAVMRICDEVRRQIGVRYPEDSDDPDDPGDLDDGADAGPGEPRRRTAP